MLTSTIGLNSVVSAASGQVSSELADEVVILDLESGVYHGLNSVAARVWGLIQDPATVRAVRDQMIAEFEVEARRCESDLLRLLQELQRAGLVDVADGQSCCSGLCEECDGAD